MLWSQAADRLVKEPTQRGNRNFVSCVWFLVAMMVAGMGGSPQLAAAQTTLVDLSKGQIIQIAPNSGTYMCGDDDCLGGAVPAEPYKLMYSGIDDGAARAFIMVDNYCAWESADCAYNYGVGSAYGTSWNGDGDANTTGSALGYHSDLGGSRKSINILQQLENFYNSFPATLGGVAKGSAIPSKAFDTTAVLYSSDSGAVSLGVCQTSSNSIPYGNIGATFTGTIGSSSTCVMTSRVSLPSYEEWLGGLYGVAYYPPSGTLGYVFCQARFNAAGCDAALGTDLANGASLNQYSFFDGASVFKRPFHPWLRSPLSGSTTGVFNVNASSATYSLSNNSAYSNYGVLPWLYIQSSLPLNTAFPTQGSYNSPHCLLGDNSCNTPPAYSSDPTAENSADPTIGAFASYISGFDSLVLAGTAKDEDIGQTLTIQYQIDSTSGSWSNLTTLTANGSNQTWSGTVTIPAGLAAGSHTIYIRVFDGHSYSGNKSVAFVLDLAAPVSAANLVGGVLCTGTPTIYCSAPTGIDFSASDNAAGFGAYRTQWDTVFAAGAAVPVWISAPPPSNLATTGHTTPSQTHTLYYQTRDKVGNTSSVESISYYINSTPTVALNNAAHHHVVTPYNLLVFNGTFTDLDLSQTTTIKATIGGVDYVSQTYATTGGIVNWELVIPFSAALASLPSSQLTNFPFVVTDSAGVSSTTYYDGQISVAASTSSQIYISVMRNTPFSMAIGKVGAFNIAYGTNSGVTVSINSADEIVVAGALSAPTSLSFGVTTLVFTILDALSDQVQKIEFV
ncbi:hypothetical protein FWH30_02450 [Microgenomates group bacterium]|nr:hypothetical protein [Microgenomates group bacterium]